MRRLVTLTPVIVAMFAALAASPAAANTAYSNVFTLDLRTTNPDLAAVLNALDDLKQSAQTRVWSDHQFVGGAVADMYLVIATDPSSKNLVQEKLLNAGDSMVAVNEITHWAMGLGGGVTAGLAIANLAQEAYFAGNRHGRLEAAQAMLHVLRDLNTGMGRAQLADEVRRRLAQPYSYQVGGQRREFPGFEAVRQSIGTSIDALKNDLQANPPLPSFPYQEVATLIHLTAQSLRDTTNREGVLRYFDADDFGFMLMLSGNAPSWRQQAAALFEADRPIEQFRVGLSSGLKGASVGLALVKALVTLGTGGVGATLLVADIVVGASSLGANWYNNNQNVRKDIVAVQSLLALTAGSVDELQRIHASGAMGGDTGGSAVTTTVAMVEKWRQQPLAVSGYGVAFDGLTYNQSAITDGEGKAPITVEVWLKNTGQLTAKPRVLAEVSCKAGLTKPTTSLLEVQGPGELAPGQRSKFLLWGSVYPLYLFGDTCTIGVTAALGPALTTVREYGSNPYPTLVVTTPSTAGQAGKISVVPVGAGSFGATSGSPGEWQKLAASQDFRHQPAGASAFVTYEAAFDFGQLDLHVVDGLGRHVGFNSAAGSMENQIPGAQPPVRGSNPQVIRLPYTGGEHLVYLSEPAGSGSSAPSLSALWTATAAVAGANALQASAVNRYVITAIEEVSLPGILEVAPQELQVPYVEGAAQAVASIALREVAGQAGIAGIMASNSSFVGKTGNTIPASAVLLTLGRTTLGPRESTHLDVQVPLSGRSDYPYTGTITVASSSGSEVVQVTVDFPGASLASVVAGSSRAHIIPSSGHTAGAGGTVWRSDAVVHNPGSGAVTAHLFFMKRDQSNASARGKRISIAAGASVKLEDLVLALFGESATSGAILVASDADLIVTSRTFNNAASGTYGQYIEGYPLTQAIGPNQPVRLIQLTKNANYRTNIGVANASGETITVKVDIHRSDGSKIGTRTYTVQPYGYYQETNPINILTSSNVDDAYAVVSSATPSRWCRWRRPPASPSSCRRRHGWRAWAAPTGAATCNSTTPARPRPPTASPCSSAIRPIPRR